MTGRRRVTISSALIELGAGGLMTSNTSIRHAFKQFSRYEAQIYQTSIYIRLFKHKDSFQDTKLKFIRQVYIFVYSNTKKSWDRLYWG